MAQELKMEACTKLDMAKKGEKTINVKLTQKEYELLQKVKAKMEAKGYEQVPSEIRKASRDESRTSHVALGAIVGLGAAALLHWFLKEDKR